jgi:hypothetical protein
MKIFCIRIGFFFALLFLVTNCGSAKKSIVTLPFEKPAISLDEEIYVPHLKSERNFSKILMPK